MGRGWGKYRRTWWMLVDDECHKRINQLIIYPPISFRPGGQSFPNFPGDTKLIIWCPVMAICCTLFKFDLQGQKEEHQHWSYTNMGQLYDRKLATFYYVIVPNSWFFCWDLVFSPTSQHEDWWDFLTLTAPSTKRNAVYKCSAQDIIQTSSKILWLAWF